MTDAYEVLESMDIETDWMNPEDIEPLVRVVTELDSLRRICASMHAYLSGVAATREGCNTREADIHRRLARLGAGPDWLQ